MDIATVIGMVLCVGAVIGSILAGGDLTAFIDVPSVIVVGLGLIGATFIKWPMEIVTKVAQIAMKSIFFTPANPKDTIEEIGKLAETARRESVSLLRSNLLMILL